MNPKTDIQHLIQQAEAGDVEAQFNLGLKYAKGQDVEQSDAEAVRWWLRAAEQGDVRAQVNVGVMYAGGQGVEQSYEEAVRWLQCAAEQGYAERPCSDWA